MAAAALDRLPEPVVISPSARRLIPQMTIIHI
jgi:hypothetical protein